MTHAERFWTKVDKTGSCWAWTGALWLGYGRFHFDYKTVMAHRYSYELVHGPIPKELHIDHLCRNRACVNPKHLEPVTPAENVRRGIGQTAINARLTHCKYGHALTEDNVYHPPKEPDSRHCRTCKRRLDTERKQRRRYSELRATDQDTVQ